MKKILTHELVTYLFFGILATLVYMVARFLLFALYPNATLAATLANITAIVFAFFTNDHFVFKQVRKGWKKRFLTFFTARLTTMVMDSLLALLLVDRYPWVIGQFVHNDLKMVNAIETLFAQFLIMVLNYLISKFLVFKDRA